MNARRALAMAVLVLPLGGLVGDVYPTRTGCGVVPPILPADGAFPLDAPQGPIVPANPAFPTGYEAPAGPGCTSGQLSDRYEVDAFRVSAAPGGTSHTLTVWSLHGCFLAKVHGPTVPNSPVWLRLCDATTSASGTVIRGPASVTLTTALLLDTSTRLEFSYAQLGGVWPARYAFALDTPA